MSLDIIGMVKNGSSYIGLTSKRWGIESSDDGKHWNLIDCGNYNFYQLLNYKEQIVCITDKSILIFNASFNKVDEVSYLTDTTFYNSTISGNQLISSSGHGKLTITNLDNRSQSTASLSDYGGSDNYPVVKNLCSDNKNQIFFTLNNKLVRINLQSKSMDTIVNLRKLNGAIITTFNDELYYLYSLQKMSILDSLFFFKIELINKSYNKINKNTTTDYITGLSFNSINYLNQNTIIAVGKNNLIYYSKDAGVNWELKSFLGNYLYVDLFEGKEARTIGNYSQFYSSADYGTTWLPSKNYFSLFYDYYEYANLLGYQSSLFYKDKNNGFLNVTMESAGEMGTVFTNDGGKTLNPRYKKEFYPFLNSYGIENKDNYLFFQWGCLGGYIGCWSIIFELNDTLGIEKKTAIRATQMFYAAKWNDKIYSIAKDSADAQDIYSVLQSEDNGAHWKKDFTFIIDKPFAFNSNNAVRLDNSIFASWSKLVISNNDTFLLQSCYQIDIQNKGCKKIIEVKGDNSWNVIKIKDNYFFVSYYYDDKLKKIIINMQNSNNISTGNILWDQVKFNRFSIPAINNCIGDSILIFTVFDSLTRSNALYFANVKKTTNIDDDIEIINNEPLYISRPIPQPAQKKVRFRIFWDQILDIENTDVAAYNLLGECISFKSEFTLTKYNNYSGELTWTPEYIQAGIYFISLRNGINKSSSIVIFE